MTWNWTWTRRLLHGLAVVATGAGILAIFLARLMSGWATAATHEAWPPVIAWIARGVVLGLCVWAILGRWRWSVVGPALAMTASAIVYLAWDDALPPPMADLGPRVSYDDEGYKIMMWMAKGSPHCRLAEDGALPSAIVKEFRMPKEPAEWAAFVRGHHEAIAHNWAADRLGREWIEAINKQPPAGVWPQGLGDPIILFHPTRASWEIRIATAYEKALAGQRDKAVQLLLPLITAMNHLQSRGPCLIYTMMASVALKRSYHALGAILDLGGVSDEMRKQVTLTLHQTTTPRQAFRNGILGEQAMIHDGLETVLHPKTSEKNRDSQYRTQNTIVGRWLATAVLIPLSFNRNLSERKQLEHLEKASELAAHRDLEGLNKHAKVEISYGPLKNPVGRTLQAMALTAFTGVAKSTWDIEDLRLALLKRLEAP